MALVLLTLPERAIWRLRRCVVLSRFLSVGKGTILDPVTSQFSPYRVSLGNNVAIGSNAYFGGTIYIHDNVMISRGVAIVAGGHLFGLLGKRPRFIQPTPRCVARDDTECIVVEDDCWIGAQVTLVGNVRVGMGAVIGAGSVTPRDIPPSVVAVGNPCRPIKRIFDDKQLAAHLDEIGYPPDVMGSVLARRADMADLPVVDYSNRYASEDLDCVPS